MAQVKADEDAKLDLDGFVRKASTASKTRSRRISIIRASTTIWRIWSR